MITVYLGLGSNLGNREENIKKAIALIKEQPGITVEKISGNYETIPVSDIDQGKYINAAIKSKTKMDPYDLLETLKNIEKHMGRQEGSEPWSARLIDIDILLYDDLIIDKDEQLVIPHPLMHERYFVLKPLMEIAPELKHPVFEKTIKQLYQEVTIDDQ